jgi:hypothetical protein
VRAGQGDETGLVSGRQQHQRDFAGELCAEVGDGEGDRRRIMGVSKPPLLH